MDFEREANDVWKVLEQLRDMEPADFEEMAPKYLELVIRRAATQAARGVIIADRAFEAEVRAALSAIDFAMSSLRTSLEAL